MKQLPMDTTDEGILSFVDEWARLLEQEDYEAAFGHTDHAADSFWTPELIREAIKEYGQPGANNRVTVEGRPTDIAQRKSVDRRETGWDGRMGYVWYDLNLNGLASDLTATFDLVQTRNGISVQLADIHVM